MRRAISVCRSGLWPVDQALATVTLSFEDRHRRRIRMQDDEGEDFLLDLPHAALLNEGDGLEMDDGTWLKIAAAVEEVLDVTCPTPEALARIAWHIGNRHMPVQVLEGGLLRVPADHVIAVMLQGLGAKITRKSAPFSPEPGAYSHHDH